jgi:PAS domain S-box-containing protein
MENTPAHLAYLDSQFNFVAVNSAYAKGSGRAKEELIGRNHFTLFPNPENQAIFEQVRDTGRPVEFHAKPFEYADQPWRGVTYWDWALVPIKDEAGRVQGVVFSLLDVTELVQAEEEHARLAAIVESSYDAIIGTTLDGIITNWNPGAEHLYGYSAGEAVGTHVSVLIPSDRAHEFGAIIARLERGERTAPFETVRMRKDGSRIDVSLTVSPIKDAAGRIIGAASVTRDVSQRIELDRLKDQFISVAAHELKTPVAIMKGYAQALMRTPDKITPQQRRMLEAINRGSDRISDVVGDLLDISRLLSGRLELSRERIDLPELVAEVVDRT